MYHELACRTQVSGFHCGLSTAALESWKDIESSPPQVHLGLKQHLWGGGRL